MATYIELGEAGQSHSQAFKRACKWSKTSLIFHIYKPAGLRCPDLLKSFPDSNSLLVSDSVGTTSNCSLLVFHSQSASRRRIYVASVSQYPSQTCICARLLTQSSRLNCPKSTIKVRSHGNSLISADTQICIHSIHIDTDAENAK